MRHARNLTRWLPAMSAAVFIAGDALADKPDWAGGGRREAREERQHERHEGRRDDPHHERSNVFRYDPRVENFRSDPAGFRFDDRVRIVVRDYYYGERFEAGHCPPGLAKKRNGCLPPGQAKKWRRGEPLPAGIVYYDLPPVLLGRLPPPPPHHRYVRVAGDILLIAIGTAMVVDAIEDLGRLP